MPHCPHCHGARLLPIENRAHDVQRQQRKAQGLLDGRALLPNPTSQGIRWFVEQLVSQGFEWTRLHGGVKDIAGLL